MCVLERRSDSEGQPSVKKRKTRGNTKENDIVADISESVKYGGFLTIFDHKHKKLLKNGDYEVVLYSSKTVRDNGDRKWENADPLV